MMYFCIMLYMYWTHLVTRQSCHQNTQDHRIINQSIKSSFIDYTFDKNAEGFTNLQQEYKHEKPN